MKNIKTALSKSSDKNLHSDSNFKMSQLNEGKRILTDKKIYNLLCNKLEELTINEN